MEVDERNHAEEKPLEERDPFPRLEQPFPYRPSWANRLNGWAGSLPMPAWVFYLGLGLGLLLVAVVVVTTAGVPLSGTLLFYFWLSAFSPAYLLALIFYLDQGATAALERFRPVMQVDMPEYNRIASQLSTMPNGPALLAFLVGAAYAIAALLLNAASGANPTQDPFPTGVIVLDIAYRVLVSGMAALLAYHTIHQLRLVSLIYTQHTQINLFRLGPLYSLSNLAAYTAIGIAIPTYLWLWLNTSANSRLTLADLFPSIFFSAIILVTFIWPLLGAHRLLEREKQRLLDEVTGRMEATSNELHNRIDAGAVGDNGAVLLSTLNALVTEQGVIQKLRTWPWRTETVNSVIAALLVPILLYIVQGLLERIGF